MENLPDVRGPAMQPRRAEVDADVGLGEGCGLPEQVANHRGVQQPLARRVVRDMPSDAHALDFRVLMV
ncbi:hypothetical protein ABH931_000373 [Streptacidiphilus sp. MAP12-33]|uniref:hypothetical protein n=1 Tax=Streptacidiphilus sp. MAP12-33 TaxID=3156266 RepID=UPI00351546E8